MTKEKPGQTDDEKGNAFRINDETPVDSKSPQPNKSSPNAPDGGEALKINGPASKGS